MKPADVDLSDNLASTFGKVEYERVAVDIIRHLAQVENRWDTVFKLTDIPVAKKRPAIFAMFCAGGWIASQWDPAGFIVKREFVDRVGNRLVRA